MPINIPIISNFSLNPNNEADQIRVSYLTITDDEARREPFIRGVWKVRQLLQRMRIKPLYLVVGYEEMKIIMAMRYGDREYDRYVSVSRNGEYKFMDMLVVPLPIPSYLTATGSFEEVFATTASHVE